jgi:hypothetical protein
MTVQNASDDFLNSGNDLSPQLCKECFSLCQFALVSSTGIHKTHSFYNHAPAVGEKSNKKPNSMV